MNNSVIQSWLSKLAWKKQTVALECLRAPDVPIGDTMRGLFRFIRAIVLNDADPSSQFMDPDGLPLYYVVHREFERLPLHCAHHILQSLLVIAIDHPDMGVKIAAGKFYDDAANALHLNPETAAQYEIRLG